jgi:hypothetical protein
MGTRKLGMLSAKEYEVMRGISSEGILPDPAMLWRTWETYFSVKMNFSPQVT